jgi:hypothetical protein
MSEEVTATERPEDLLEALRQGGGDIREQLAERLQVLKGMLDNVEAKMQTAPTVEQESTVDLSLLQVEKSIMILREISADLRDIRVMNTHRDNGVTVSYSSAEIEKVSKETLVKIVKIYDNVVDKLGR